jgi:hypothetical protein
MKKSLKMLFVGQIWTTWVDEQGFVANDKFVSYHIV